MLRPHPAKMALGAWFDGEGSDRVGAHVLRCNRCQRHVSELSRLRSWLRAQPFVAMSDGPSEITTPSRGKRPALAMTALLAAFFVVADRAEAPAPLRMASPGTATTSPAAPAASADEAPGVAPDAGGSVESAAPEGPAPGAPANRSVADQALARARQPEPPSSLRLGLIVPTSGTMAAEGREVTAVVRQRVAAANAAGGVAGMPVELEVAPAEKPAAVADMVDRVDTLVGGFGAVAPAHKPWLLPADPAITGPLVIPAELSARLAGAQLGNVLRRQGITGPVGVVVGSGPDAALGTGLATRTPVTSVTANEAGTCVPEIATLRRSGAVALAVAGSPDLAVKCLRAAFAAAWLPSYGRLVAPSAAYAGLHAMPEGVASRTVLGLPWPTSTAPGAARFRSTTQSTSYRALVSYAATELAIDVARQQGAVSLQSVEGGSWRTDLIDITGLTNRANTLVVALAGTWLIAG